MGSLSAHDYLEHELQHYTQRYSWDCGVACVVMLLGAPQRDELLNNFHQICAEEGFGTTTWTIDLCYLLKRFGVPHRMYTTMLGVNEAHKQHSYYRSIIDQDRERVSWRFENASASGVRVAAGRFSTRAVLEHLRRGPALLLVDAGLLACDLCKHNKLKADFRRCFGGAFSGHFIVLVGHSRGRVLYRDPALSPRLCAAPPPRLARARAPPTDRDVILVDSDYTNS